jgi:hypothetical protein
MANQKSVRYSVSISYFTNIAVQNVNKVRACAQEWTSSLIWVNILEAMHLFISYCNYSVLTVPSLNKECILIISSNIFSPQTDLNGPQVDFRIHADIKVKWIITDNLDLYYTCKFNKNRCDLPFIHCSTCVDIYQWNLCCYSVSWIVFNEFTQFCRVVFSYPTGLRFMLYAIFVCKIIYYTTLVLI